MESSKDPLICIGIIGKAHGVLGDVVVHSFTQNPRDFLQYKEVCDGEGKRFFKFQFKKPLKKGFVVHIESIDNRESALVLKQTKLYVRRSAFKELEEEEFYFVDLEGLDIFSLDNDYLGRVCSVQDLGAGVYLEAKDDKEKIFTIPFTKDAVPRVDIKLGRIDVNPDFLLRVGKKKEEKC